jgi:hypothetical protein
MANYLDQSEASMKQAQAAAYEQTIQPSIDQLNKQLADTVAEMNSKIVTGMSDTEKADLQGRIEQLKTQYADALSRSQGQFAFAQKAAETSSAATQQGLQDVFKAQQALAAQALGQTAVAAPGSGYIADVAGAQRAAQQNAAAGLAVTGGDLSVPQGALVRTPALAAGPETTLGGATAGGLIGVSAATADLYKQMLEGSRARALTDLEAQRNAIDQTIRLTADQAARQREAEQRAKVDSFKQQALMSIMSITASKQETLAGLQAAVASASTQTERQKAQAELDKFSQQEKIRLENDLKRINAQNRASGGTGVTAAEKAQAKASSEFALGIAKLPDSTLQGALKLFTNGLNQKNAFTKNGVAYDPTSGLYTVSVTAGGKVSTETLDPTQVFLKLQSAAGAAAGKSQAEQLRMFKLAFSGLDSSTLSLPDRTFLRAVYGNQAGTPEFWVNVANGKTKLPALSSTTLGSQTTLPPPLPTRPTPTPSPGPKPTPTLKINPAAKPKDVSEAKTIAEASRLAEGGAKQPERFALPNGVNVNVFTYKGKRYASPIGMTTEIYEWNDAKKSLGRRI